MNRVLFLFVGCTQLGCGPATPAGVPPTSSSCEPDRPALEPIEDPKLPASRLGLSVSIAEGAVQAELERSIPVVVAQGERQRIGAAGLVDYRIQRRGFSLDARGDQLIVRTELAGRIAVCKPFGPVCARYGTCHPRWDVEVALTSPFFSLRTPPELTTRIALTKGCVLSPVGYNATRELESITRKQARRVRREIRARVDSAHERWLRQWQAHGSQLRYGKEPTECLQVNVERVLQSDPILEDDQVQLSVGVEGTMQFGCSQADVNRNSLPKTERARPLDPPLQLTVAHRMTLAQIAEQLRDGLRADHPEAHVELHAGKRDSRPTLLLGAHHIGACASQWIAVEPFLDGDVLRLRSEPLPAWLKEHARFPLPAEWLSLRAQLEQQEALLTDKFRPLERDGFAFRTEAKVERNERVLIGKDSIQLELSVQGQLSLTAPARTSPGTILSQPGAPLPPSRPITARGPESRVPDSAGRRLTPLEVTPQLGTFF